MMIGLVTLLVSKITREVDHWACLWVFLGPSACLLEIFLVIIIDVGRLILIVTIPCGDFLAPEVRAEAAHCLG